MESLNEVWEQVSTYLSSQINEIAFNSWIKILKLKEISSGSAVLTVKTAFQKQVVEENYGELLAEAFYKILSFPVKIVINIFEEKVVENKPLKPTHYEYTFDTFIIGPSNRFAHAASLAVAENPSVIYNPLFIHGNSGLGKTHLLNAIRTKINEKFPEKVIITLTAENFTNEFINATSNGTLDAFRNKYRTADVLLVDDIQFIAGKVSTQEEFFNTLNTLHIENKQVVFTSDRPPKDISSIDVRIKSRFEQGLIADIQPPELETRVGIISRKAQLCSLNLSNDIIYYIAEQVKTNIRQLEGVVKKLYAFNLSGTPITIAVAHSSIRDIKNDNQPEPVTVKKIIGEVSRTYSISIEDIISDKQDAPISHARQVSMYVVREITGLPFSKIGEHFGNRDHSTVVYAMNKIKKVIAKNSKEKSIVNDIIVNLQSVE